MYCHCVDKTGLPSFRHSNICVACYFLFTCNVCLHICSMFTYLLLFCLHFLRCSAHWYFVCVCVCVFVCVCVCVCVVLLSFSSLGGGGGGGGEYIHCHVVLHPLKEKKSHDETDKKIINRYMSCYK